MKRLIHTAKGKFWEYELSGAKHSTASGSIGGKPRVTEKEYKDEETAQNELGKKIRKKLREGFVFPRPCGEIRPGDTVFRLLFAGPFTGFLSLELDDQNGRIIAGRHASQQGPKEECNLIFVDTEKLTVAESVRIPEFDVWKIQLDHLRDCLYFRIDDTTYRMDLGSKQYEPVATSPTMQNLDFDLNVPSNRILLGDQGCIRVVDLDSDDTLLSIPVDPMAAHPQHYEGCLSPSGGTAAICREAGRIELHDLGDGRSSSTIQGDFGYAWQLCFHPVEPLLLTREEYGDWKFQLWNIDTGEEDRRFHTHDLSPIPDWEDRPKCVFFDFDVSPDGSIIAFRDAKWIVVCDFATGKKLLQIEEEFCAGGFNTSGFRLKFSADGRRIVVRTDLGVLGCYQVC